jgi:hypothetical protein
MPLLQKHRQKETLFLNITFLRKNSTMKELRPDWFLQPVIDFESKSYLLRAWLQQARNDRESIRLYPWRNTLREHLQLMEQFTLNMDLVDTNMKTDPDGFSWDPPRIRYKEIPHQENDTICVIRDILEWSMPRIAREQKDNHELHESLLKDLSIEPVGIEPMFKLEGYLFLAQQKAINVYTYQLSPVIAGSDQLPLLRTNFLFPVRWSVSTTLSGIKNELQKSVNYPIGAYVVHSSKGLPLEETFLPLAKLRLIEYLAQ